MLARGDAVIGVDNLNDYYDPGLKRARLTDLEDQAGFAFRELDIATDGDRLAAAAGAADRVVHLAAEAGVRHSFDRPEAFVHSNLVGFYQVAQLAIDLSARHFVYASSSSVYGGNPDQPHRESVAADHPLSFYGATKKANEAMAHALAHVHGLPMTGLRFFTVYGPWGRPDMSYFKFAERILAGRPIQLHNHGRMTRDFTFIDDVVAGVLAALDRPPAPDPEWAARPTSDASGHAPYRVLNIGSAAAVSLADYVAAFERATGEAAIIEHVAMEPGEALDTHADLAAFQAWTEAGPPTPLDAGVKRFIDWYRSYYGV